MPYVAVEQSLRPYLGRLSLAQIGGVLEVVLADDTHGVVTPEHSARDGRRARRGRRRRPRGSVRGDRRLHGPRAPAGLERRTLVGPLLGRLPGLRAAHGPPALRRFRLSGRGPPAPGERPGPARRARRRPARRLGRATAGQGPRRAPAERRRGVGRARVDPDRAAGPVVAPRGDARAAPRDGLLDAAPPAAATRRSVHAPRPRRRSRRGCRSPHIAHAPANSQESVPAGNIPAVSRSATPAPAGPIAAPELTGADAAPGRPPHAARARGPGGRCPPRSPGASPRSRSPPGRSPPTSPATPAPRTVLHTAGLTVELPAGWAVDTRRTPAVPGVDGRAHGARPARGHDRPRQGRPDGVQPLAAAGRAARGGVARTPRPQRDGGQALRYDGSPSPGAPLPSTPSRPPRA